jgi:hypothetical protein
MGDGNLLCNGTKSWKALQFIEFNLDGYGLHQEVQANHDPPRILLKDQNSFAISERAGLHSNSVTLFEVRVRLHLELRHALPK